MESIFLRLVNMSLSAAAVIAVVALLRLILRSAPKKWRYLLWSAPAFRLACPVSFRAFFSIFRLRPPAAAAVNTLSGAASRGNVSGMTYISRPAVISPLSSVPAAQGPIPSGVLTAPLETVQTSVPVQAAASADPMQIWLTIGAAIWLAGLAVMLILGVVRYLRMKGKLADAAKLEEGVFASDAIRVPFILGLTPPRIYVPAGLEGKELGYVLRHERAHLRRCDHWAKLLAYLLLSLHWFNPLVWLGFYLMSRDMEMSCDERVLSGMEGEAKDYSRTLLSFALGRRFPAPAPLGFGESDVASRIKNALRWRRPKLWVTVPAVVLCLAAIAACTANPSSGWLEDDDAVLNYAISNYQIEGQAITGGSYLYAGGREDGSAYKKFLVYLEDGTPRILTVNGTMIKRFGKMGTAMRAKGFESEDIQNSPWMWFHSLRSEAITEAAWGEYGPKAQERSLSDEQRKDLVARLNVLQPEEVVPGRGGPMNRYVKLVTDGGTITLRFDGRMIELAMDDAIRARYPIPEGDPSPEWVIQSGSPPFEFLYSWLDALEFETSDEPKLPIPDIAADTKDDTVFFAFSDGSLTLRGREGKTNQDLIDFVPFTDVSFRPEDNFLSPGDPSILSGGALRPGLSIPETRLALFGYTYHSNFGEEQMQRPQIILHTAEEGSDHPVTGIYAGQLFDLNLGYGLLFTGDSSGQLYDRNLVSGGSDAEILADITLTFLPNEGEDHAAVLYALLRSALTQQLGPPQAEEPSGHYDRKETVYDKDGHPTSSSEPVDYAQAVWWDDTSTLTVRLEIGQYYSRSLTIDFYETIHYVDQPETPEDPLMHMAALQPADFYINTRGYSAPEAGDLAEAMNAAAAHPKNHPLPEDAQYLYWELDAYYNEQMPYDYTQLLRHFQLEAGLAEDLVKVTYYGGKGAAPSVVWVEDPGLYGLIRNSFRREPAVEAEAWEKFGASVRSIAGNTIGADGPYGEMRFTDFTVTCLEKTAFTLHGTNGELLPVYFYDIAYLPEDIRSVTLSGRMGVDGDLRVTGAAYGQAAALEDALLFCEDAAHFGGMLLQLEEIYQAENGGPFPYWREAYREVIENEILNERAYTGATSGPVLDLGLADLSGDGIPELICYLPGGGKSNAAAIVTFEEGEARAFNASCSFGLPLAKYAVEACFSANPQPNYPSDAAFRYDAAQGFWVLNSANATELEQWCSWYKFGMDRCGYLACEELVRTELYLADSEGGYRETGWVLNGERVTQEAYHAAADEYDTWLDNLGFSPFDAEERIKSFSLRESSDDLPDRLAAWLGLGS